METRIKSDIYRPKYMTVFNISAWFCVCVFNYQESAFFINASNPMAFKTKEAAQNYCDYLNIQK